MAATTAKAPEATRRKILEAAFAEFYRNGFQGGSLNHIVEAAGTTKGALFHHFDGKQGLGYAVVDEIIGPLLRERWLAPVEDATDPLSALEGAFQRYVRTDIESGHWLLGCPLNNLAQEMSPLDGGFQERINELYDSWRARYVQVLTEAQRSGSVRAGVDAGRVAALLVSAQMGIWGSGKSSQRQEVMKQAMAAVVDYLESLRP